MLAEQLQLAGNFANRKHTIDLDTILIRAKVGAYTQNKRLYQPVAAHLGPGTIDNK
jgi:hypothetical protein